MTKKYAYVVGSIFSTLLITGCNGLALAPEPAWDRKQENKSHHEFLVQNHVQIYLSKKSLEEKSIYLNEIATRKIHLIDHSYLSFKNKLKSRKTMAFGSSSLAQLFNVSATLFSPASTKTLLSAGATSVTGLQGNFDKHLLAEKSIEAIINQMDAQRAIVYKNIRDGLQNPSYTLMDLNRDLDLYMDAGTIEAAMREITNTAAKNNTDAQTQITTTYSPDESSSQLNDWLNNEKNERISEREEILKTWLKEQQSNQPELLKNIPLITNFIYGSTYKNLRNQFIKEKIKTS